MILQIMIGCTLRSEGLPVWRLTKKEDF